ncbi:MAG: hypothetical protein M3O88_00175, partial [Actinomycetota bacterium]|nr:hypothetical protein [Actinomycetota bacterium]
MTWAKLLRETDGYNRLVFEGSNVISRVSMTMAAEVSSARAGLRGFIKTDITRIIGRGTWLTFPRAPVSASNVWTTWFMVKSWGPPTSTAIPRIPASTIASHEVRYVPRRDEVDRILPASEYPSLAGIEDGYGEQSKPRLHVRGRSDGPCQATCFELLLRSVLHPKELDRMVPG